MRADSVHRIAWVLAVSALLLVGCRRETALTLVYPDEGPIVSFDAGVADAGVADAGHASSGAVTPERTRVWVFPSGTACGIVNQRGRCEQDCDALWEATGGESGAIGGDAGVGLPAPLVRADVEGRDLPPLSLPSGRSWDVLVRVDLVRGTIRATGVTVDEGSFDPTEVEEDMETETEATYYACETVNSGVRSDLNLWRPWCSRRHCPGRILNNLDDSCWREDPCCTEGEGSTCASPSDATPPCQEREVNYWPFDRGRTDAGGFLGACRAYTLSCETGSADLGTAPESFPVCIDARNPDPDLDDNDRDCDGNVDSCERECESSETGDVGILCRTDAGEGTGSCVGEQWTGCVLNGDPIDGCDGGFNGDDDDSDGYVDEGVRGYVDDAGGVPRREFLADGGVPYTNRPTACNAAHDRDAGVVWDSCGVPPIPTSADTATCLCGGRACLAGQVCCAGQCVNLRSDPDNCGRCGERIDDDQRCQNGLACVPAFDGGFCTVSPRPDVHNLGRDDNYPRVRVGESYCVTPAEGPCAAHQHCVCSDGRCTCQPYTVPAAR
jgi:hypothetical protein